MSIRESLELLLDSYTEEMTDEAVEAMWQEELEGIKKAPQGS